MSKSKKSVAVSLLTKEEIDLLNKKLETGGLWNSKDNFENKVIKPGDTIYGIVENVEEKTFKSGKKEVTQSYCTLKKIDGENVVIALSTVLQTKFDDLDIKVTDKVAVRYIGEKKNYHVFDVARLN